METAILKNAVVTNVCNTVFTPERNAIDSFDVSNNEVSFTTHLKEEYVFDIPEESVPIIDCTDDYQTTLIVDSLGNVIKPKAIQTVEYNREHTFATTDDESMAVEALRQLGGIYTSTEREENNVPLFTCELCEMQFFTAVDLEEHSYNCNNPFTTFLCEKCNLKFVDEKTYTNHLVNQHERLACKYCNVELFTVTDLCKHIKSVHSTLRLHECEVCHKHFPRHSSLKNHLKIHSYKPGRALENLKNNDGIEEVYAENLPEHWPEVQDTLQKMPIMKLVDEDPERIVETKLEEAVIDIREEIVEYLEKEEVVPQANRPYCCVTCGMSFSREKAMISHMQFHNMNGATFHECHTCGDTFPDKSSLNAHKKQCNTTTDEYQPALPIRVRTDVYAETNGQIDEVKGKHPCIECDKWFSTKQKMHRHMWIHRRKVFTCELCTLLFKSQTDLDKHRLTEHPIDSPHVCQDCGKSFASRQGLWEHGRVHGNGAVNFECRVCNKTFTSRQGHLIHTRTHTGERPYGCRFCLKAFRDGGTLRKHERIHTGERPHVCPLCMHDFNQKVVLREHIRWVHAANKETDENGRYPCDICPLFTVDREELCAHLIRHSDQLTVESKTKKHFKPAAKLRKSIKKRGEVKLPPPPIPQVQIVTQQHNLVESDYQKCSHQEIRPAAEERLSKCDLCETSFSTRKELIEHVKVHI